MISPPSNTDSDLYYTRYLQLNTGQDLLPELERLRQETLLLVKKLSQENLAYSYAPEKWSISVLLQHICDAERVYGYRALRFLKGDSTDLPGFDENEYADKSITYKNLDGFVAEYNSIRNASIQLFANADLSNLDFNGTANGLVLSPRIIGWLMVGHNIHHLNVLKERYLLNL